MNPMSQSLPRIAITHTDPITLQQSATWLFLETPATFDRPSKAPLAVPHEESLPCLDQGVG